MKKHRRQGQINVNNTKYIKDFRKEVKGQIVDLGGMKTRNVQ
jgi:hypothetical protein